MPKFLHVGCGQKRKNQTTKGFNSPNWDEVRFDIDGAVNPDITGTILDMNNVSSGTFDAVYSSHNIEHVYPHEVAIALKEFSRVLKPEGFVVITCPDLQSVCELVAKDQLLEPAYTSPAGPITPLDILYGHRPALQRGNYYMAHKCGFTLNALISVLRAHGFRSVAGKRREKPFFDLFVIGFKSQIDEAQLRKVALQHFPQ
ncbi:MAG: SAM-dependent methyltransferase [Magnetovibrio sp.]|nr:SAM-dependent methyltransferase [Magnetovibrio sp.]|tara:strand:+ start:10352 stop:10954 length:603 start_codon:yes stop_codon:yes gene_type:complete